MIAAALTVAFICAMSVIGVIVAVRLIDGEVNWKAMVKAFALTFAMAAIFACCTVVFVALVKRLL